MCVRMDAAVRLDEKMSAAMDPQDRADRARAHMCEGERLVAALREMIDEQSKAGVSTEPIERLLQATLSTLDRLRTKLC